MEGEERDAFQMILLGDEMGKQGPWSFDKSGTLFHERRLFVPELEEVQLAIVHSRHDSPLAGHPGRDRTTEFVQWDYYWPQMAAFVRKYVESCESCQRNRLARHKPYGFLKNLPVPEHPSTDLSMDFIEELPLSGTFNSILVVTDRFTKRVRFIPTRTDIITSELAEIFLTHIFTQTGIPSSIVSDQGSKFTSDFWQEFVKMIQVNSLLSTAYHPQTDGATERVNQSVESYIRHHGNYYQDDWSRILPLAEFVFNNLEHTSTKLTPFFATYGFHPKFDILLGDENTKLLRARVFAGDMKSVWEEMKTNTVSANKRSAKYFDRKRARIPDFAVGQKVYISGRNIKTKRPTKKFEDRRYGPFEIIGKISSHAWRICLPETLRIHNVFHADVLEPHHENPYGKRIQVPGPVAESPYENEFEVDAIVNSRRHKGEFQYQIRWTGYYGDESVTWEPIENLGDCSEVQDEFHLRFPKKATPPGWKARV
jgi:transposase InsO family protein